MQEKQSFFERLMFRQLPLWIVAILLTIGLVGTAAFGSIAIYTQNGGKKTSVLGDFVLSMSSFPVDLIRDLNADMGYLRVNGRRFEGRSGFEFQYEPGTREDAGYLLLSRYDGDDRRSYIEFWDLNAQKMLHVWAPPVAEMNAAAKDFKSRGIDLERDKHVGRVIWRHPLLTGDGSLILKSRTPMTKLDACNRIVWVNDDSTYHHALEMDAEGDFWVSSLIEPSSIPHSDPETFFDDAIAKVSSDGELVFQRSVADLLLKNGMPSYVYGPPLEDYEANPIHLNDVQPVLEDGPFWKKGDVFLSLRTHSIVMLYRPESDEIIWWREKLWAHQHDVDILDENRIAVFDNNSYNGRPYYFVAGHSDVAVYDFRTGEVSRPWSEALASVEFMSATEGLHTIRPNGNLFVEEQNYARILEFDAQGKVLWEYVNGAEGDGALYRTGWSRIIERDRGLAILEAMEQQGCL